MKPSRDAFNQMRERGFDPATIAAEEKRLEHFEAGLELCPLIEAAFEGVTLGAGVGLAEAIALDDYLDDETRAQYREGDEKLDWRNIPTEKLSGLNSFVFMDAEGARFHLPAYMICELKGDWNGIASSLAHVSEGSEQKYRLLTPEQRAVVRLFLLHSLKDPDSIPLEQAELQRALEEYWR